MARFRPVVGSDPVSPPLRLVRLLATSPDKTIAGMLLLSYPVNLELIGPIRPVDVVLLAAFSYLLLSGRLQTRMIPVVIAVVGPALVGAAWGKLVLGWPRIGVFGVGLLLKYLELSLLIWVLSSLELSERETHNLIRLSAIVFWLVVAYVYLRVLLSLVGVLQLSRLGQLRADFPFTDLSSGENTAGHLMGAYLATGLAMWWAFRWRAKKRPLVLLLSITVAFGAIVLTGSRTPFLALAGTACFSVATAKIKFGEISRRTIRFVFFAVALGVAVFSLVDLEALLSSLNLQRLADRAFNFAFGQDQSAVNRIAKSSSGLKNLYDAGVLLGAGVFAYPRWFDNGVIRVVHDVGVVGAAFVVAMLSALFFDSLSMRSTYAHAAVVGFVCFAVASIATEFFLVARAFVPFCTTFYLLREAAKHECCRLS